MLRARKHPNLLSLYKFAWQSNYKDFDSSIFGSMSIYDQNSFNQ
jgi:hypothetical protein